MCSNAFGKEWDDSKFDAGAFSALVHHLALEMMPSQEGLI